MGLLLLQTHFAASYLVPLDKRAQGEFGGLLQVAWPWAYGNGGPLGQITLGSGFPIVGFWIAMSAALLFAMAALAVGGLWVPFPWWRTLAVGGAVFSIALMVLFFDPTKLLPIAGDLTVLALTLGTWMPLTAR
ncbi:MAG TPA: hypothetical protein VF160_07065 [Candidatus Dormibacteraeota bacterium]